MDALIELALDMGWSWHHGADTVWQQLAPRLWELTHNPWGVLQTVSRDQLKRVFADPAFCAQVTDLVHAKRQAAEAPAWFQRQYTPAPLTCIAYFSMEFLTKSAEKPRHACRGGRPRSARSAYVPTGVTKVMAGFGTKDSCGVKGTNEPWGDAKRGAYNTPWRMSALLMASATPADDVSGRST